MFAWFCRSVLFGTAFLVFAGCATLEGSNIRWANENNIRYQVVEVSDALWANVAKPFAIDPKSPCFFVVPDRIYVRGGQYLVAVFGDVRIYRPHKDYCLNHEIGHLREYLEGVPFAQQVRTLMAAPAAIFHHQMFEARFPTLYVYQETVA